MNTKKIAYRAGVETSLVNEIARDLDIEMTYNFDLHYWDVTDERKAHMLIDMLIETREEMNTKFECPSCGTTTVAHEKAQLKCSDCNYWMIEVN